MKVGIHYDLYDRVSERMERYEKILRHNGIEPLRLSSNQPDFWERVKEVDLFLYRYRTKHDYLQLASTLMPIIENHMGIKCFPNLATSWHYDDKIKQYYLAVQHELPMIESWVFWDKKAALQWAENAQYPVVFKLKGGAASANVALIRTKKQAGQYIRMMFGRGVHSGTFAGPGSLRSGFKLVQNRLKHQGVMLKRRLKGEDPDPYYQIHKNYVYFQKFLPRNDFDTRVTVIGHRAFAFIRYNRKNDFRSSGSGVFDTNPKVVDLEAVKTAFEVSQKMNFQSMAYAVLKDPSYNFV